MIKLLAFDWDDVFILGAKDGYFNCYHQTMKDLGVNLGIAEEKKRIAAKWSQPAREEFKELLKERLDLVPKACKIYEKKLFGGGFEKRIKMQSGVPDILDKLSNKYKLAVVTGMHPKLLKVVFKKFKIPPVFSKTEFGYNYPESDKQKPSPFMLNKIMKELKVLPNETWYIGDARQDVELARNAGVEPVVVLTGYLNKRQAKDLDVEYIIKNVTKIESVLKRLEISKQ